MKKQQSGFTLIELVVVIVILGILAATAIPRFVNLETEAETAAAQGILGSVLASAALRIAESPYGPKTFVEIRDGANIVQGGNVITVTTDQSTNTECDTSGDTVITVNYNGTDLASATISEELCSG